MDKLENYRQIITKSVQKHAQHQPSHGEIESLFVGDTITDNYLLLDAGWDRSGRVHAVVVHLRIIAEKVWIELDGTEEGIALELLKLGIPKEDIVLGFISQNRRHLIDFSVA